MISLESLSNPTRVSPRYDAITGMPDGRSGVDMACLQLQRGGWFLRDRYVCMQVCKQISVRIVLQTQLPNHKHKLAEDSEKNRKMCLKKMSSQFSRRAWFFCCCNQVCTKYVRSYNPLTFHVIRLTEKLDYIYPPIRYLVVQSHEAFASQRIDNKLTDGHMLRCEHFKSQQIKNYVPSVRYQMK